MVLASSFSAYLAVKTADPLVVDDYYKQGLAINQSLRRDRAAASLQLTAAIDFNANGRINVRLKSTPGAKWPASLELLLAHPSREERDQKFLLLPTSLTTNSATYTASASTIDHVAYRVVLHDLDKQ